MCQQCVAEKGRDWYRRRQATTGGLYSIYVAMKQRCHSARHDNYANYGGRGIRVCDEWRHSFEAFHEWARTHGYQRGLQIDRIDNDQGYCAANCRFVTPSENARNKRKRKSPLRNGATLSIREVREVKALLAAGLSQRVIGRRFGVSHTTIGAIKNGRTWSDISPTTSREETNDGKADV